MNAKYIPPKISTKDRKVQVNNILRSRKMYKKGIFVNRRTIKSYTSKPSNHVKNAMKTYNITSMIPSREMSRKTGCSIKGLREIVKKGQAAYYSSGSRPNQTASSWGLARLASSITGKKASVVDYHILKKECKPMSIPLLLHKRNRSFFSKK